MTTQTDTALPESVANLFIDNKAKFISSVQASKVEQVLAEHGVSFVTKIVKSRRSGLSFEVKLLPTGSTNG